MSPKPLPQPWLPPTDYTLADVAALNAVANGVASADQQKHALDYLFRRACGLYDETYFADSERNTAYAQGKRGVALHAVSLINNAAALMQKLQMLQQPKVQPSKRGS